MLRMCGCLFPQPVQLDIHVMACELRSKFRNKFPIQGHRVRTVQCSGSSSGSNTGLLLNIFVLESVAPVRILHMLRVLKGTAVAQWLRCCATNQKVAGSIPAGVVGFFIDIKSFRSHYGPGVDSASNRNKYQEHFLGVKAAGA